MSYTEKFRQLFFDHAALGERIEQFTESVNSEIERTADEYRDVFGRIYVDWHVDMTDGGPIVMFVVPMSEFRKFTPELWQRFLEYLNALLEKLGSAFGVAVLAEPEEDVIGSVLLQKEIEGTC